MILYYPLITGDASEEEEEVEVEEEEDEEEEDEEDEELFQTPSWRPPAVPITTSAAKPLPLFSPSSPLSGCNIKVRFISIWFDYK